MGDKISKLTSVFKKDGVKTATKKAVRYTKGYLKKHFRLAYKSDFKKNYGKYSELISKALCG